ncbi:hypothetical protein [Pedobacter agri]|uniref:hypothetical protein n=1 Tax=Pedobacter agri TaxID=454586 RepID=UPI0029316866|nr:hypothetical protein [Pedobacter agri]
MKKISYVIALLIIVTTAIKAQKLNTNKVPFAVKSAFSKTHPKLSKVSWSKENENFEAEFILNEKKTSEAYTSNGDFVESEVEIKFAALPSVVKKKLKDQKVAETAKITKANGKVIYEAEVKGKDLLFDAIGNPVKF